MAAATELTPKKNAVRLTKGRGHAAPTKRTLNLMIREKKSVDPVKWVPGVLIVLAVAALFGKFAVADRYAKLNALEADLAAQKQKLEDTRAAYADYNEVQEQYNRYTYTDFDRTIADRLDVMAVLEREVFPVCDVGALSISGKAVSLSVTGLSLEEASALISRLEAEPLVASVFISNSNQTESDPEGSSSMTIQLADATTVEGGSQT